MSGKTRGEQDRPGFRLGMDRPELGGPRRTGSPCSVQAPYRKVAILQTKSGCNQAVASEHAARRAAGEGCLVLDGALADIVADDRLPADRIAARFEAEELGPSHKPRFWHYAGDLPDVSIDFRKIRIFVATALDVTLHGVEPQILAWRLRELRGSA